MKKIILLMMASALLSACNQKPVEEVHTVEWFKQPENREAGFKIFEKCRNDPGTYGQTPNCINLNQAIKEHQAELMRQRVKEDREKALKKYSRRNHQKQD